MTIDFNQLPRVPAQSSAVPASDGGAGAGAGTGAAAGAGTADPSARDLGGLPLYAALRALNHLLKQQDWARGRLLPHAGRCVRIGIDASFPLAALAPNLVCRIGEDGLLHELAGGRADVSLWLKPSIQALFAGLREGPKGLAAHLRVDGDVLLAGVLAELAQHLRWDVEEDLSRVVGDVAAHRAVGAAQALRARAEQGGERVASATVQYFTVEQPHLVDAVSFALFRDELAELQQRVGALSARL